MTEEETQDLLRAYLDMMLRAAAHAMQTSLDDPEQVANGDRVQRFASTFGRNVEKCIAMTQTNKPNADSEYGPEDVERLRKELHQRLVRYANRLGTEELHRRLRDRGLTVDDVPVEVLRKIRSDSTADG